MHEPIVTVSTQDLLSSLRFNLVSHEVTLKTALAARDSDIRTAFRSALESDETPNLHALARKFPEPASHVQDYREALLFFAAHSESTVSLSLSLWRRYMNDDWDWKHQFRDTVSNYGL